MKKYVIIGNGTAAVGAIEGIRAADSEGLITVVSAENHHVYCRPLISYYLEGKTDLERIKYRPDGFYEKQGCTVLYGERAEKIDVQKNRSFFLRERFLIMTAFASAPAPPLCAAL